jgi:hypothetical protein
MGKMRETAPKEAVGCIIDSGARTAKWKSWITCLDAPNLRLTNLKKRRILNVDISALF